MVNYLFKEIYWLISWEEEQFIYKLDIFYLDVILIFFFLFSLIVE